MRKLRLYLDTSIINFLFADDAPESKAATTMSKTRVSKAQREVWQWKEDAYSEVAHLDTSSAIRKRLRDAIRTTKRVLPARSIHRG
jgi:hypothetical protein